MKKFLILTILILFTLSPVFAATNDFTADGNITVSAVVGDVTADMLIMDTSTAESWTFDSGTFTVTDPGTFRVGSSDSSVISIKITLDGTNRVCQENSTPGTTYATAPTAAGTYTIVPSTTTDCTSLCTAVANAATYNSFSTCGAATCNSGYTLSGSGASATCVASGGGIPLNILQQINQTNQQSQDQQPATEETTEVTTETSGEPAKNSSGNATLEQMASDAKTVATGDVNQVIAFMNTKRNPTAEVKYNKDITEKIIAGSGAASKIRNTINNFITYGTPATRMLGAGERGGVVNSFRAAFGKLPTLESDWNDVIKIANGRWPNQRNATAEDRAKINFKKVYLREANMSSSNDNAAITVMAYGLRPANRNLASEKAAIKSFKAIYGYASKTAVAWDMVRAIAYSGATR
jgi:hypothetical protein